MMMVVMVIFVLVYMGVVVIELWWNMVVGCLFK